MHCTEGRNGCLPREGVSAQGWGDVCPGGGVCPGWGTRPGGGLPGGIWQTPLWTEWQTRVKTLLCRNFVAGGNKNSNCCQMEWVHCERNDTDGIVSSTGKFVASFSEFGINGCFCFYYKVHIRETKINVVHYNVIGIRPLTYWQLANSEINFLPVSQTIWKHICASNSYMYHTWEKNPIL